MNFDIAKIIAGFALYLIFMAGTASSQEFSDINDIGTNYYGNVSAPDFPSGLEWLNTNKPLSIKELRGKLVLIDFWTYCCINCIHIMPDLRKLEDKYKNELVVIGVHSAKFLTERGTDNIRQSIFKYEISHPVVNDKDFEIWNMYSAKAWPTLMLIDPYGKIIGMTTGEGVYDEFDPVIAAAINEYDRAGKVLDRTPLQFALEKDRSPKTILSFPGKIAADPGNSRIFITDSNNNRILVLKISSNGDEAFIEEVIGTGKTGSKDGIYLESEFFHPQGITFFKDKLYVADTENHLIREIDLDSKLVKTIAGLGYQSQETGIISGYAGETALNSPWDLALLNDVLYIAMAGRHQIWKMDLLSGKIGTYIGSGRENIVDGPFLESSLAQPSGITTDGLKLYIADSEVSAIRSADISKRKGNVNTIVGKGLFDFGDIDGLGNNVRLQHPLGIVYNTSDNLIYIADTYNHKIKVLNPLTRESKTFAGTGFAGIRDGNKDAAQFNEPNGLAIVNGKIFITDTNNNLLRVIDMTDNEVKTIRITNPDKLSVSMRSDKKTVKENVIPVEPLTLKQGEVKIKFDFTIPAGFHINPEALPQITVNSPSGVVESTEMEIKTKSPSFEISIKVSGGVQSGNVSIEVLLYYCDTENQGICRYKDLYFEIPVSVVNSGKNSLEISYVLM